MTEVPLAGTFRLDGMLQGALPPDPDTRAGLEARAGSAKTKGLHMHLRIEGGSYSLVADPGIRKTSILKGKELETLITNALQDLIDLLPPEMRENSFSTIRSEEFRPGTAVQILYTVGLNGIVSPEQRIVDIDTDEPAPEITAASLRSALVPALLILFLTLFVSTFFIDYRRLFSDARERIAPLKMEELVIHQELSEELITIELLEVDRKKNTLVFKLTRGPDWQEAMKSKPAEALEMDWPSFTTLLAIRHGRCRIVLFNKDQKPLVSREIEIRGLHENETIEIILPVSTQDRIATVSVQP